MEENSANSENIVKKFLNLFRFTPKETLITIGSMIIFAVCYALLFEFWFSVLITIMLLMHEMGHVFACRIKKMRCSSPIFIPFLGALIKSPDIEADREKEAFVGYGGPLLGSLAAIAIFGLWIYFPAHPESLILASFWALFINFFNLIPVRPLDGGRVAQIISDRSKYVGILVLAIFIFFMSSPILWIVWLFCLRFIKLKPNSRCLFGVVLQILMTMHLLYWSILFSGKAGPGLVCLLVLECLAFMMNLSYFKQYKSLKFTLSHKEDFSSDAIEEIEAEFAPKIELPRAQFKLRLRWLILYVGLSIFILFFMLIQFHIYSNIFNPLAIPMR